MSYWVMTVIIPLPFIPLPLEADEANQRRGAKNVEKRRESYHLTLRAFASSASLRLPYPHHLGGLNRARTTSGRYFTGIEPSFNTAS